MQLQGRDSSDLILDEDATVAAADLVVLATGQVPNSGVNLDEWTIDIPEGRSG